MRPGQLFVEKRAEARLIDRGRQGFLALGVERPVQDGAANAALEAAIRLVRGEHVHVRRIVLELRPDVVALQLVVLVAANGHRRPERVEHPVHVLSAAAHGKRVPAWRQLNLTVFDDRRSVLKSSYP